MMNEEHPLHMLDNQADPDNKPKIILQKAIRTYESDVADAIANKKTSSISMAVAENQRKIENNTLSDTPNSVQPSNLNRKILMSLISIVIIIAGLGGGYYLYSKSPLAISSPVIQNTKIPSIINPNIQKILAVNNLTGNQLIKSISTALQNEKTGSDSINELILTQIIGSTTLRVSSANLIEKLNLKIPDILVRTLNNSWMLGVYGSNEQNLPFIIVKNDFFQNAYAGMLNWESSMPDELADLLNYRNRPNPTENSSSSISSFFTIRGKFEDRTILNRDVREFINNNGELLVLYSFIDKDTLLIATSEITLKGLIGKIEKQTYIRYN